MFPKDSNSASPNPLCDNATIIMCHGDYEDALKGKETPINAGLREDSSGQRVAWVMAREVGSKDA